MPKFKLNIFVLIAISAILIFVPVMLLSNAESRDEKLNSYLDEHKAKPQERQAYHFALEHPDVLKVLPCYCGCTREGHKSNYNCFFKEKGAKGKDEFDMHGLHCPMCVDIALYAKQQTSQKKSLQAIRKDVDAAYGQYPQLTPTKTPKP